MRNKNSLKTVVKIDSLFKPLVPDFLRNRYIDIQTIISKTESLEFQDILKIVHNIRGLSGTFGFKYITEASDLIESHIAQNRTSAVAQEALNIKRYLDNLDIVYIEDE